LRSDRQIRIPGGASSGPTITVDPVVVVAETDSKRLREIEIE
jgi:hypothetical protein